MKILVIAPHPDDEILGVGGTIAKKVSEGHEVYICIITKGFPPYYEEDFIKLGQNQALKSHEKLGVKKTFFLDFPTILLEDITSHEIIEKLQYVVSTVQPDELYIPFHGDIHVEHKIVSSVAMVIARPKVGNSIKKVYAYETISETGWDFPTAENAFIPNVFEDITDFQNIKITAMQIYDSQLMKFPEARSIEALVSLMKFRGATVGVKAAEAFMLIREVRR